MGSPGAEPCRVIVPPRPHQDVWARRCASQIKLEAAGSVLVWFTVVPRDRCADIGDARKLIPQAGPLLEDRDLQVDVLVVGERAPLLRVPARGDEKVLPPVTWERAWVHVNRVLVAVVFRRMSEPWRAPCVGMMRGELPIPKSDGLELLRRE